MPALPDGFNTALVITGIDIPDWSAWGLTQTLVPIGEATVIRRTVNGEAVDLSNPIFRKYSSTISGREQHPPSFNGVWPGMEVTVECIKELNYRTATGSPDRDVVAGSSYTVGDFTFYRPELTMLVEGYDGSYAEWRDGEDWSLSLVEV